MLEAISNALCLGPWCFIVVILLIKFNVTKQQKEKEKQTMSNMIIFGQEYKIKLKKKI